MSISSCTNSLPELGELKIDRTIGKGTFGKVKLAIHQPTGKAVAVKILEKNKIASKADAARVKREIGVLRIVNHPNLLRLLQIAESPSCFYLVTELVEGE